MITVTPANIAEAVKATSIDQAREKFSETTINLSGIVLKKVTREPGNIRLYIEIENGDTFREAFCNFPSFIEQGRIESAKLKKQSTVNISGTVRSFGESAICLNDCRLLTAKQPVKLAVKPKAKRPAKVNKIQPPSNAVKVSRKVEVGS